jgi:hypothetical protein
MSKTLAIGVARIATDNWKTRQKITFPNSRRLHRPVQVRLIASLQFPSDCGRNPASVQELPRLVMARDSQSRY